MPAEAAATGKRRPSLVLRLLLVGASMVVTLALCEVAARVFDWRQEVRAMEAWQRLGEQKLKPGDERDTNLSHIIRLAKNPRIVYEMIPNLKFRFVDADVRTNEFGFRGPSIPVAKPPGSYRVVVIGDSVAFGHGVAEADAFPWQLEAMLRARRGNDNVQVIDTAVSGYNTAMEVETLVDKGLQFAPDLVVYHYIGNDLDLPNLIWNPRNFWSVGHSFLWEKMSKAWAARDPWTDRPFTDAPTEAGRFAYKEGEVAPMYRDMVGLEMFRRELTRLKRLGVEHGFQVIVSSHWDNPPYVAETCKAIGLPYVEADQRIRAYMKAHGIDQYIGSELTISAKDPHPRALVHKMIAEAILDRMVQEGFAPN